MRIAAFRWLATLLFACALAGCADAREEGRARTAGGALPAEAHETLRRIDAGGPHPYPRDGITFQNRERRLPEQPRGYYREYTVPTPGSRDRGARRIVTGGNPPVVWYYTADHYQSFQRIDR